MKIFLTGESGMLATAIKNGIPEGYTILDYSDLATFSTEYHKNVLGEIVKESEIDFTNLEVLAQVKDRLLLEDEQIIIVHTGAYVNTDKCENLPYDAVKSNVLGTQYLVELAKQTNAWFIHFSTTAIYDPDWYELSDGYFNEDCKIDSKTIYGLTKYNSQLVVKQSDLFTKIILQPVFIYGDAPNDNSSMIRKICEIIYCNKYLGMNLPKLDVLLSRENLKDYMRYEGFSAMFNEILLSLKENKKQTYIISREAPKKFDVYLRIIAEIFKMDYEALFDYINLIEDKDYLGNHCGSSSNFRKEFPNFSHNDDIYDDEKGIRKTVESIILNLKNYRQ